MFTKIFMYTSILCGEQRYCISCDASGLKREPCAGVWGWLWAGSILLLSFCFLEFLKSGEDSALGLDLLRCSEVIQGFAGLLDIAVLVTGEERRSSARAESG